MILLLLLLLLLFKPLLLSSLLLLFVVVPFVVVVVVAVVVVIVVIVDPTLLIHELLCLWFGLIFCPSFLILFNLCCTLLFSGTGCLGVYRHLPGNVAVAVNTNSNAVNN